MEERFCLILEFFNSLFLQLVKICESYIDKINADFYWDDVLNRIDTHIFRDHSAIWFFSLLL